MPRLAELAWGFVLWRERENGAVLQWLMVTARGVSAFSFLSSLRANITLSGESRSEERVTFFIQAVTGWCEPACDHKEEERDLQAEKRQQKV